MATIHFSAKVSTHRSNVTHWGHGDNPRNYRTECYAGTVSTGSRAASQYLRVPATAEVTCKKCVARYAAEMAAAEEAAYAEDATRTPATEGHEFSGHSRRPWECRWCKMASAAHVLVDEKAGIRGYVFNFVGKDGRHASVVFDRYGHSHRR